MVEREKKIFNSYIIVEADLTPEVYTYIRNMPGVTKLSGDGQEGDSPRRTRGEPSARHIRSIATRTTWSATTIFPADIVKITGGPLSPIFSVSVKSVAPRPAS
jgi:transcription antitermination factor NusG